MTSWLRYARAPTLAAAALLVGAVLSVSTGGRSDIGLFDLWSATGTDRSVLLDIRLPRTSVAALLGVNLGLAGLILQSITRNPLASPAILGINQGAAFGVALGIVLPGVAVLGQDSLALLGALAAGAITFAISGGFRGHIAPMRLILGGVAVGAFAYALVRFTYTLEDELARSALRWTVGDIADVRWPEARRLAAWAAGGGAVSLLIAQRLNLMALGHAAAKGLGADPRHVLRAGLVLAALLAGACVSVAGPIAFAGLVVPHIAKALFGADHRVLVPAVACIGAALMLAADGLSKLLTGPVETPIGIIVALIGAPWFLWLTLSPKAALA